MKIAHVVCTFPPYQGGIGNTTYHFAEELTKLGQDITVFTPVYNKQDNINYGFNLVRLNPVLKYGNGAFLPQLFWRLGEFDIVHLHYPFFGGVEPVWLRKIVGGKKCKLVIHYHMDTDDLSPTAKLLSLPSKLIESSLFKQADAITCASLDYIDNSSIGSFYKNNKNKFYEIPFGVDTERFKPDGNWLKPKNVILFVGALDKAHNFKGLDILLQAMVKIDNKKLIIVGGGDMLDYYSEYAKKIGAKDKVNFIGKVSDAELPKYYNQADLFVLSSTNKHEAFGLVLLEAMASGLPVIASDLPGVRKVFTDGQEGLSAKIADPFDLAEKIKRILSDEAARARIAQSARQLAIGKYSWKKSVQKLNEIYNKINS